MKLCHLKDNSKTGTRADRQNASVVRTLFDLFHIPRWYKNEEVAMSVPLGNFIHCIILSDDFNGSKENMRFTTCYSKQLFLIFSLVTQTIAYHDEILRQGKVFSFQISMCI